MGTIEIDFFLFSRYQIVSIKFPQIILKNYQARLICTTLMENKFRPPEAVQIVGLCFMKNAM